MEGEGLNDTRQPVCPSTHPNGKSGYGPGYRDYYLCKRSGGRLSGVGGVGGWVGRGEEGCDGGFKYNSTQPIGKLAAIRIAVHARGREQKTYMYIHKPDIH